MLSHVPLPPSGLRTARAHRARVSRVRHRVAACVSPPRKKLRGFFRPWWLPRRSLNCRSSWGGSRCCWAAGEGRGERRPAVGRGRDRRRGPPAAGGVNRPSAWVREQAFGLRSWALRGSVNGLRPGPVSAPSARLRFRLAAGVHEIPAQPGSPARPQAVHGHGHLHDLDRYGS